MRRREEDGGVPQVQPYRPAFIRRDVQDVRCRQRQQGRGHPATRIWWTGAQPSERDDVAGHWTATMVSTAVRGTGSVHAARLVPDAGTDSVLNVTNYS